MSEFVRGHQLEAATITNRELAPAALSADATGRAIIQDGFFDLATVSAKFAAASIADDRLAVSYIKQDGTRAFTGNQSLGGNRITNLGAPTAPSDAVNRSYAEQLATAGKSWREALLIAQQFLSGASGGILQAIAAYIATNPTDGDTFVVTDGTITETFTFKNSPAGAFEVQIGGTAAITQTNLIAQINTDSTLWSAVATTGLDKYFGASPASQFSVYRKTTSGNPDRLYGTLTAAAGIKVVSFADADAQDYQHQSGTEVNLPAADPAAKRFGFNRTLANLRTVETHLVAEDGSTYTWDEDDQLWRLSDTGTIIAGAGLTRTGNTIDVGAGAGIQVNADTIEVIYATPTVNADADAATSGVANSALRSDAKLRVSTGTPATTIKSDASAASTGTASELLRRDAQLVALTAAPSDVGTANAQGTSTSLARADHIHRSSFRVKDNKDMAANATANADGQLATATTLAKAIAQGEMPDMFVNGIRHSLAKDDSERTAKAFYISGDGGTTARTLSAAVAGDQFYWNKTPAGYRLKSGDRIDACYGAYGG